MARFHVPSSINSVGKQYLADHIASQFPERVRERAPEADEGSQYCLDLSLYDPVLTEEEHQKHDLYESAHNESTALLNGGWIVEKQDRTTSKADDKGCPPSDVLDNLTLDDIRHLVETEDELSQAKG